jgi:hypothetical protein
MNNIISKYSYFHITSFAYNVSFSLVYFIKFYSKNTVSDEANEVYNLIFFQMSAVFLLIFFSILNPLYIYSTTIKGIENRIKQNKTNFDILGVNIISLKYKITPYLITLIYLLIVSIFVFVICSCLVYFIPPVLEFFKFPFQFVSNINNSKLYYGVYSFLILNLHYILINPKESAKNYYLKFGVYLWSCVISFCISAFFILLNMLFYFKNQDSQSGILIDKSKIAFAMFFNLFFIVINYLTEKKIILNDEDMD